MLSNYEDIIRYVLLSEGRDKFTDDPVDRGGATKWGITYASWFKKGWDVDKDGDIDVDDLKKTREADAIAFYKQWFWDKPRIGEYPAGLRYALFDMFVNSGANAFGMLAQAAGMRWAPNMNTPALKTNASGNVTYWNDDTFIQLAKRVSIDQLTEARKKYYEGIVRNSPEQAKFIKGWLNRATHVLDTTKKFFKDNAMPIGGVLLVAGAGLFFLMRRGKK